ncbi:hypothetical protein PTTG_02790 [Puccinia triticina 1-1 BBBD Race 1]|uniref:Uncharacterized protein n=2 Tax=Puccinia triticina TaxID=208348 RepID=A0A0C4EPT7_PUCT1|nr:hypothetical protein PTTG_02790 [Puccinia triticina 1-1 BBBD Race 1]
MTPKIAKFATVVDTWHKYWKQAARLDLQSWDDHSSYFSGHPVVIPLFFVYVEILISVLPATSSRKPGSEEERMQGYREEMAKALNLLREFKSYLANPRAFRAVREIWREKRAVTGSIGGRRVGEAAVTLAWHLLEIWVEAEHPQLWLDFKNQSEDKLHKYLKKFFNNLFFYGIEGLTNQAHKIVVGEHL